MEQKFIRVRSKKSIIISIALIIIGCILSVIPGPGGMNLGGYLLVVVGVILLLLFKGAYRDVATKATYLRKELLFCGDKKGAILSAIASNPNAIDVTEEGKGQALRLDIYYSKELRKAYIQLFAYIPHSYEPCSERYEYEIDRVEKLL